MNNIGSMRNAHVIRGTVFIVMPHGIKSTARHPGFDFDRLYETVYRVTLEEAGMTPIRIDPLYGRPGVLGPIRRGIEQAEIVLVDFTTRAQSVVTGFAWACLIGKKLICLTQSPADIPTDARNWLRYITYSPRFDHVEHMKAELRARLESSRKEPPLQMTIMPPTIHSALPALANRRSAGRPRGRGRGRRLPQRIQQRGRQRHQNYPGRDRRARRRRPITKRRYGRRPRWRRSQRRRHDRTRRVSRP